MQQNWPSLACPSSSGSTFWSHEWDKHGTCSESILDQHGYFRSALDLKENIDLLQILQSAGTPFIVQNIWFTNLTFFQTNLRDTFTVNVHFTGIQPDGGSYSLSSIKNAIKSAIGSTPWIECNADSSGNSQLYQIYICVDTSGSNIIQCPVMPTGKCSSNIQFPSF